MSRQAGANAWRTRGAPPPPPPPPLPPPPPDEEEDSESDSGSEDGLLEAEARTKPGVGGWGEPATLDSSVRRGRRGRPPLDVAVWLLLAVGRGAFRVLARTLRTRVGLGAAAAGAGFVSGHMHSERAARLRVADAHHGAVREAERAERTARAADEKTRAADAHTALVDARLSDERTRAAANTARLEAQVATLRAELAQKETEKLAACKQARAARNPAHAHACCAF
jgi:hypothetical protein